MSGRAAQLIPATLEEHDFEDDVTYRGVHYAGLDMPGRSVESFEIERCRFTDTKLSGLRMAKSSFTESAFVNCDLANAGARDTSLLEVEVKDSRMTGSSWAECVFRDTTVEDCRADLTTFRFSRFRRTVFRNCNLQGADFQDADLTGTSFEGCNLRGARFSNAVMAKAKFANCDLLGINGVTSFAGAVIDSNDLPSLAFSLAGALGITIAD
jgi:uncharacterized protein YjbI with pentapeptide repeats